MMRNLCVGALALAMSLSLSVSAGERSWYVAVEGGANWSGIDSNRTVDLPLGGLLGLAPPSGPNLSADQGWAIFGALGTSVAKNVRLEGELGHRSAEFGDAGGIRHTTVIANVLIDIPIVDQLTFTVGAGAGLNWIETDGTPSSSGDFVTSGTEFAYQGIAALAYPIAERVDVTMTYRYMDTSVPDTLYANVDGANGNFGVQVSDASSSTLSVGLRVAF